MLWLLTIVVWVSPHSDPPVIEPSNSFPVVSFDLVVNAIDHERVSRLELFVNGREHVMIHATDLEPEPDLVFDPLQIYHYNIPVPVSCGPSMRCTFFVHDPIHERMLAQFEAPLHFLGGVGGGEDLTLEIVWMGSLVLICMCLMGKLMKKNL